MSCMYFFSEKRCEITYLFANECIQLSKRYIVSNYDIVCLENNPESFLLHSVETTLRKVLYVVFSLERD